MKTDLSVEICGIRFKNPVIAASGTFGFGREYDEYFDISILGGIATKGLTLRRREGNPPPRIAETPSGMLNSVGLQNPGVKTFIEDELPWLMEKGTVIIANIAGSTMDEYREMVQILSRTPVHMIELNISCPNVRQGGMAFGSCPGDIKSITEYVRPYCKKPLIVKLTPNVMDITECALAAEKGGADVISMINSITGMAIDIETHKPILKNITGGLTGPAIRPVAMRMVWQAAKAVNIPIIGMGGIWSGSDAIEFMLAGAYAVSVGTATVSDPLACPRIIKEMEDYALDHGVEKISRLTGTIIID